MFFRRSSTGSIYNKIFCLLVVVLLLGTLFVADATSPKKPKEKDKDKEGKGKGEDGKEGDKGDKKTTDDDKTTKPEAKVEEDCPLGTSIIIVLVVLGFIALLMTILAIVFICLFFTLKSKMEKMEVDAKAALKWAEMDKDYSKLELGSAYHTSKKKGGKK
ncbi:unnamed protein product [Meloidogyne enterolobii]|uniref:Uncharacterized protein n=1 Tax=Meloidogyne enterolobii TaxID=390850 RepID=A0ACB1AXY2_MELEN